MKNQNDNNDELNIEAFPGLPHVAWIDGKLASSFDIFKNDDGFYTCTLANMLVNMFERHNIKLPTNYETKGCFKGSSFDDVKKQVKEKLKEFTDLDLSNPNFIK